jgi:hypothetical protein
MSGASGGGSPRGGASGSNNADDDLIDPDAPSIPAAPVKKHTPPAVRMR